MLQAIKHFFNEEKRKLVSGSHSLFGPFYFISNFWTHSCYYARVIYDAVKIMFGFFEVIKYINSFYCCGLVDSQTVNCVKFRHGRFLSYPYRKKHVIK